MSNQLKAFEINCDEFIGKKNGMNYLSWSNAWGEFKKVHPMATYKIIKNKDNIPVFGNSDIGYMVYTEITVEEVTHEMWLHIMDFKNKAMKNPDMTNINKTVMRCLVKNMAMFGLGINIYQGEDFPNENTDVDRPLEAQSPNITNAPADEDFLKQIKDLIDNYFGTAKGGIVDATLEKCLKYYKVNKVEDIPKVKLKGVFNKLVESVM